MNFIRITTDQIGDKIGGGHPGVVERPDNTAAFGLTFEDAQEESWIGISVPIHGSPDDIAEALELLAHELRARRWGTTKTSEPRLGRELIV